MNRVGKITVFIAVVIQLMEQQMAQKHTTCSFKSSPPCPAAGTFMVARIFCRSLSWIGWVGLVAPAEGAAAAGVVGVVSGEAPVPAEGVVGVVGT